MAIWDGSAVNNTFLASTWNHLHNSKAVNLRERNTALLNAITGEDYAKKPEGNLAFDKITKITGDKIEVRFQNRVTPMDYVPTIAANSDAATVDLETNSMGNALFDISVADKFWGIDQDSLDRIKGDDSKSFNFVEEKYNEWSNSVSHFLGGELFKGQNQARGSIGGLKWIVSDAQGAGESAYAQYGFNRADAANADFRGIVVDKGAAALTLSDLLTNQVLPTAKKGITDLGVCDATLYGKIVNMVSSAPGARFDYSAKDVARYGRTLFRVGDVGFALDAFAAPTELYMLDTRYLAMYVDGDTMRPQALERDPRFRGVFVAPQRIYAAMVCTNPQVQIKLKGTAL